MRIPTHHLDKKDIENAAYVCVAEQTKRTKYNEHARRWQDMIEWVD